VVYHISPVIILSPVVSLSPANVASPTNDLSPKGLLRLLRRGISFGLFPLQHAFSPPLELGEPGLAQVTFSHRQGCMQAR
jgi:hypothetical protein